MKTLLALPAGVWLLGAVSLLNDVASEAIYPLLPFFLTTVLGATAVSLGVIEGAAEAVSSVLKVISGRLSDRWRRRKPIVVFGYSLSGAAVHQHRGVVVDRLRAAFHRSRGKGNTQRPARRDARRLC
jgi:MFS family permease